MDLPVNGPYKATQTWNELVELFRFGIPLKKHRKHIKVYESSFTGIEAVNFFQEILKKKTNLNSDISKEQTVKLLDKFLKANIFQTANNISKKELTFKPNGDLYQLSSFSSSIIPLPILNDMNLDSNDRISFPKIPHKSKQKRNKSKENIIHIPKCKKNDISKSHKDINALKNFNQEKEILTTNNVPKTSIKRFPAKLQNNTFYKNDEKSATSLINKASDKIQIASKLNAHPEPNGFTYSNSQHQNIQKTEMTKMVILSKLERILFKMNISCSKLKSVPAEWIFNNLHQSLNEINSETFLPEPILIKINNLYKTTPYDTLREQDIRFISNYFSFLERPLLTYQLYDIIISIYKYIETYNESVLNKSEGLDDNLSHHSYFETAFTSESPVTRIIPFKKRTTRFKRNTSAETLSYKEPNKDFSETFSSYNSISPKVSHLRNKSGGYLNPALCHSLDDLDQVNFDYVEALNSLQRLMQCSTLPSKLSVSSPSLWNDSSSECSFYTAKSNSPQPNLHSASEDKLNTTLQDFEEPEIFNFVTITWNKNAQILGVTAMQLLLLFIPTECRAQLILLLQTIKHILNRKEHFIRMFIYSTFSHSILRSENYVQTNLSLIYKTIDFLVQNFESIIHISPQLVNEVKRKIISLLNKQDKKRMPFSFCERISSEQFEQQRYAESQKALCQLLDHIINDTMMNDKNKKMRLKMFKEAYPHIYLERFPEEIDENDIGSKSRNRNFPSLMKIKNLRL